MQGAIQRNVMVRQSETRAGDPRRHTHARKFPACRRVTLSSAAALPAYTQGQARQQAG